MDKTDLNTLHSQAVSSAMQKEQLKKLRAAMELMRVQGAAAAAAEAAASAKTVDDAAKKSFEFWQALTQYK